MKEIHVFHGIGAYRGGRNPLALREQLDRALQGVELCGADRPIRHFGAIFLAESRMAWDDDVWSKVVPDGYRTLPYAPYGEWQEYVCPAEDPVVEGAVAVPRHYREWDDDEGVVYYPRYDMPFHQGIESPDQDSFEEFCRAVYKRDGIDPRESDAYCEVWCRPIAVRALWVKPWASKYTKLAAQALARHRGLPLFVVDTTTRIWGIDYASGPFYTAAGRF